MRKAGFSCISDIWEVWISRKLRGWRTVGNVEWRRMDMYKDRKTQTYTKLFKSLSLVLNHRPKRGSERKLGLPLFHRATSIFVYAEVGGREQWVGILGNSIIGLASWEYAHPMGDNFLNPIHMSKCMIRDL